MLLMDERRAIVERYAQAVKERFPQVNQYNILIFGSFLTDSYTDSSDIDIGVFSLQPGLTFRLYSFTKDYFDHLGIKNDIIRMKLSKYQYINIAIITRQNYAVTDYCPQELIAYIKDMLMMYEDNKLRVH